MAEASSRLLVDRTVIRVDGRPFFTMGPRLLLSPPGSYVEACRQAAAAGFTAIGSIPASTGTLPLLHQLFDAAEDSGLLVVLMADPRQPRHGRYLADHFRHRPNLHSYCLPWLDERADMEELFVAQRDEIRAQDLFHPIWAMGGRARPTPQRLRLMDLFAASQDPWSAAVPDGPMAVGDRLAELARTAPADAQRPLICGSLPVFASPADRAAGLWSFDTAAHPLPADPLHWFPGYTAFDSAGRRDTLGPDAGRVRLSAYEAVASGARGILFDFWEAMLGPPPLTGRDILAECSLVAQEFSVVQDFLAEGRLELCLLESGHPRLRATALRHGDDHLILLRAEPERGPLAGDAYFSRVEVDIRPERDLAYNAWRLDFPGAFPVPVVKDLASSLRLAVGEVDMTAIILLTPGRQRAEEYAQAMSERLPAAARFAVEHLSHLHAKTHAVEDELAALGSGVRVTNHLEMADLAAREAAANLAADLFEDAYSMARLGARELRVVQRIQLARAQAEPFVADDGIRPMLRRGYYTLPAFYRERTQVQPGAYGEFT
jgi:hypothetical protein